MEPFVKHTGKTALLNRKNVDTDQIIPKQFLTKIEKTGFGKHLFQDWRYLPDGSENPQFELNEDRFINATILVTGDNFGCGSSREHAPWALLDYGFRAIISTSFADIFYNNCFKNGILLIKVTPDELSKLMAELENGDGIEFEIDLEKQIVSTPGGTSISFNIDEFKKENLLKGMDQISWSLQHLPKIESFEQDQKTSRPWLWD